MNQSEELKLRNAIKQIVNYIEMTSCNYSDKQKAQLIDTIRVESACFKTLKQYIEEN